MEISIEVIRNNTIKANQNSAIYPKFLNHVYKQITHASIIGRHYVLIDGFYNNSYIPSNVLKTVSKILNEKGFISEYIEPDNCIEVSW